MLSPNHALRFCFLPDKCVLSRVPFFHDPVDYSPPGFSVHGILLARILEWVAISFSREASQPRVKTCIPPSPALQMNSLPAEQLGYPLTVEYIFSDKVRMIYSMDREEGINYSKGKYIKESVANTLLLEKGMDSYLVSFQFIPVY